MSSVEAVRLSSVPATVGAMDLAAVLTALRASWGPDTCAPEDVVDWTPSNPARGQCATTAVVLHDHFGGCLVRGEVLVDGEQVDFHWWNSLPDGQHIDATICQFAAHERVVGGTDVERPTGPTRLDEQYALLSARVATVLAAGPAGALPARLTGIRDVGSRSSRRV
jgi:hypothetical protein